MTKYLLLALLVLSLITAGLGWMLKRQIAETAIKQEQLAQAVQVNAQAKATIDRLATDIVARDGLAVELKQRLERQQLAAAEANATLEVLKREHPEVDDYLRTGIPGAFADRMWLVGERSDREAGSGEGAPPGVDAGAHP